MDFDKAHTVKPDGVLTRFQQQCAVATGTRQKQHVNVLQAKVSTLQLAIWCNHPEN